MTGQAAVESCRSSLVVAIVGPTAIGKTAVAVKLAKLISRGAEILSADSVQVYRQLDIGSAKPSSDEQAAVKFHLIDIADPDQDFTLSDYQDAAAAAQQSVTAAGHLPILAGGTGLYLRGLTQPLGLPHVPPDEPLRERWRAYAEEHGRDALHAHLASIDPEIAARLHINDVKRIVRALEVYEHTGKALSAFHAADQQSGTALFPNVLLFGLNRDRAALYASIDQRVDAMMDTGFLDEVRSLRELGYSPGLKSMQTLGYRELNAHLDGEYEINQAVAEIKLHTHQFARRQLVWFRADSRIEWIDMENNTVHDAALMIHERIVAETGHNI